MIIIIVVVIVASAIAIFAIISIIMQKRKKRVANQNLSTHASSTDEYLTPVAPDQPSYENMSMYDRPTHPRANSQGAPEYKSGGKITPMGDAPEYVNSVAIVSALEYVHKPSTGQAIVSTEGEKPYVNLDRSFQGLVYQETNVSDGVITNQAYSAPTVHKNQAYAALTVHKNQAYAAPTVHKNHAYAAPTVHTNQAYSSTADQQDGRMHPNAVYADDSVSRTRAYAYESPSSIMMKGSQKAVLQTLQGLGASSTSD